MAVGADHLAVVAGEDNDRIVADSCVVDGPKHTADHLVDERHAAVVVGSHLSRTGFSRQIEVAAVGGLHPEFGTDAVEQRVSLGVGHKRVVNWQDFGIVEVVVRTREGWVGFLRADVEDERAIHVAFDEAGCLIAEVVGHMVAEGQVGSEVGRKHLPTGMRRIGSNPFSTSQW